MKEKKSRRIRWVPAGAAVLVLLFALMGCRGKQSGGEDQPESSPAGSQSAGSAVASVEEGIALPYIIEEAGLEVRECFSSTIPNPDKGDEMAEDVASLEIVNRSGRYLKHAVLKVKTSDDGIYEFELRDLPADGVVWAFDTENRAYDEQKPVRTVKAKEVQFSQQDETLLKAVSVEEQDLTVTLTNTGAEDLNNLEVICRCNFGEQYFGGISYTYPVEQLRAGESITLEAPECYMGTAEVVDMSISQS